MSEQVLESPLAGISPKGPRVLTIESRSCILDELPFVEMCVVRGNAADERFASAILAVTGLALPMITNTASLGGERQLLWLGPDEWLIKQRDGQGDAVVAALRQGLQGQHHAIVQVGDGNTTFTIQGEAAADLIARGCPLDLHPRVFGTGALAQTHIAKASVTVLCREAGSSYELTVRRSFADYLFRWLCEAGT